MSSTSPRARKCPHCWRAFVKADHYERHIRSHTKEKPFRCDICRKAYPRHDTLLRHARLHKNQADGEHTPKSTKQVKPSPSQTVDPQDVSSSNTWSAAATVKSLESWATLPVASAELPEFSDLVGSQQVHESLDGRFDPRISSVLQPPLQGNLLYQSLTPLVDFDSDASATQMSSRRETGAGLLSPSYAGRAEDGFISQPCDFNLDNSQIRATAFVDPVTDLDHTSWLLDHDFDFTAFDRLDPGYVFDDQEQIIHGNSRVLPLQQLDANPEHGPSVLDLQPIWHTQFRSLDNNKYGANSGQCTPRHAAAGPADDIDEFYRADMVKRLRPRLRDEPLPSIGFMNLCIHLFFTRFNVTLPLVHSPTFRPTVDNALLVLSICSAGSLSLGSDVATKTGSMLFERVNKAIVAATWERVRVRMSERIRNTIRTAMIGQTFALLSGHPSHLTTATAYLGSLIALARHCKLFHESPAFQLADDLSGEELDRAWRRWATGEEMKRAALLLFIHDAEISALFQHEPLLRHNASSFPTIASSELFCAPSAEIWAMKFRAEQREKRVQQAAQTNSPQLTQSPTTISLNTPTNASQQSVPSPQRVANMNTMLRAYTVLSGIGASICEGRHLDLFSFEMPAKFESDLLAWYRSVPDCLRQSGNQAVQSEAPFSLLPLWHYTFISLSTDLHTLELAIGKEGTDISPATREYIRSWLSSSDSKRCLFHALYLQNLVATMNMDALIPIHTARILFSAALCWYCYILYSPYVKSRDDTWTSSTTPDPTLAALEAFPEFRLLCEGDGPTVRSAPNATSPETVSRLKRILAANPAEMKASTLCVLESTLRRLGTGGISKRFADVVHVFISGEMEKEREREVVV